MKKRFFCELPHEEILLAQACRDAARALRVDCVILGGAGLAGLAARIQHEVPVPLIDSVRAGAQEALRLAHETASGAPSATPSGGGPAWQGLSPELAGCLVGR